MHRAQHRLCVGRSVRAVSSGANPRPLGKWELPRPVSENQDQSSSSSAPHPPIPQGRSWSRPTPPETPLYPPTSPLRGLDQLSGTSSKPDRWAQQKSRQPPRETSTSPTSRFQRSPPPHREEAPRRDWAPHQDGGARRDAAPHRDNGRRREGPPHREAAPHKADSHSFGLSSTRTRGAARTDSYRRPGPSSLQQILRKDRIVAELEAPKEEEEGEDEELTERDGAIRASESIGPVEESASDVMADELAFRNRGRDPKQLRQEHKERGSIVARLRAENDLTIPNKHRGSYKVTSMQVTKTKEKKARAAKELRPAHVDVFIPSVVSVGTLAKLLNIRFDKLLRTMIKVGMGAEASHDHILTSEYASLLALEFGRNPVVNDEAAFDIYPPAPHPNPSTLPPRPPVVTIMGHVDHGKTTLLDKLRSTSVAKGEAGGITQHIGAFSVPVPASEASGDVRTITFLDTPGHAAFSAMRARGAGVTDIVVLVVAADDGIMPQTKEVIDLIQKENVQVVVAINKVDKPGVNVEKVEQALLAAGVQLETFGGDVPSVRVSGLTGQGLDQLVETISVLAEMQDLRAERDGKVQGYVLESKVQKGLGPVATVLVLRGCLKPSDHLIAGLSHAKVRVLSDSNSQAVKAAYPGMAVTVSGWKELPNAGDEVLPGTESEVKKALANRIRTKEIEATLGDMEAINEQRRLEREEKEKEAEGSEKAEEPAAQPQESGPKELKLVIKGDVSGSVEAVAGALEGIGNHIARVKVIATGVGDVTESDVMRAKAAEGTVVAFSVNTPRHVQSIATSQSVPLMSSTVIYRLMDDVKERVIALLPPIIEQRVLGEANVLQLFEIHLKGKKTMKIAGCRVSNGVVNKTKLARVVRNGEVVHEGRLETLKHRKDDITEAAKGTECGIGFEKYDDLREGDVIQIYQEVEKPGNL